MKKIKILAVGLVASALVLVGGIAYASIPGPDGVIHGCVASSGKILIIDSTASCPSGQTALNWNQTGPQGPAGTNGTNGVSGYTQVLQDFSINAHTAGQGVVSCPSGDVALGGGYLLTNANSNLGSLYNVYSDGPEGNDNPNQWEAGILNNSDDSVGIRVFVTCAEVN